MYESFNECLAKREITKAVAIKFLRQRLQQKKINNIKKRKGRDKRNERQTDRQKRCQEQKKVDKEEQQIRSGCIRMKEKRSDDEK